MCECDRQSLTIYDSAGSPFVKKASSPTSVSYWQPTVVGEDFSLQRDNHTIVETVPFFFGPSTASYSGAFIRPATYFINYTSVTVLENVLVSVNLNTNGIEGITSNSLVRVILERSINGGAWMVADRAIFTSYPSVSNLRDNFNVFVNEGFSLNVSWRMAFASNSEAANLSLEAATFTVESVLRNSESTL